MIAQPQYGFAPTMPMMAKGGSVEAENVRAQGRNNDTMLVHMTPREVGGLQALAMQHGGSLTINPKTGLPEAGFLDSFLPTLLGVGLNFMFPGSGALIGLGVGGLETIRTGDLGKGILAGLGAYGGANLAGSLASTGASTAAMQAPGVTEAVASGSLPQAAASVAPSSIAPTVGETALQASFAPAGTSAGGSFLAANPVTAASTMGATLPTGATAAGEGIRALGTEAGRDAFLTASGGYSGLATDVGLAAAPSLLAQPEFSVPGGTTDKSDYAGPYTPSERKVSYPDDERRRRTSEFTFFTPSNPVPFAEGGKIEERGAVQMPGADYVAGQMPEFNYGFKPVGIEGRSELGMTPEQLGKFAMGDALSNMTIGGPFGPLIKKAGDQLKGDTSAYMDLSGYQYDPQTQTMRKMASGGVAALAKGGSVPTLENGGFVLTKKAVDGLGKGSNKKGQKVANRGLGAIPIKGPGTGTSDSIKTSIDGKRPALVSNGEAYVPKKQVAKHGGAKKFYALMKKAERRA